MKIKCNRSFKALITELCTKYLLDGNGRLNFAPKNRENIVIRARKMQMAEMITKQRAERGSRTSLHSEEGAALPGGTA